MLGHSALSAASLLLVSESKAQVLPSRSTPWCSAADRLSCPAHCRDSASGQHIESIDVLWFPSQHFMLKVQ